MMIPIITNGIYLVCMIQFRADGCHRTLLKNLLKNMIFVIHMNYTMDHLLVGAIVSALPPAYGTQQEGIVIKNQTALEQERGPHILKYVNPEFKETQKNHKKKLEDPNKLNEKAEAEEYIRMIVTDARVMKCYHKLVDDGILPEKFELKHMKHVAQNLPKAVYEDCVKEELEILKKAGEFGGKLCSKVTMEIIRDKLKIG